jgi:hypothetical protein
MTDACLGIDTGLGCAAIASVNESGCEPFPRFFDEESQIGEQSATRPRVLFERRHNRTLEVRGSIPLGSTRKRKGLAAMRGLFVFGAPRCSRVRTNPCRHI